jgi:hypothetical protein
VLLCYGNYERKLKLIFANCIVYFRGQVVNHMAAAIGITDEMAASMGVVVRRPRSSVRRPVSSASGASASGAGSSASTSGSSCGSSCSCSSSSSGSSAVASTPASPDSVALVVNASPNDGWLATPAHIPLTRATPVAVPSTSGRNLGVRPWRVDIRQRRLERTLLDARGQEVPRRSE